MDNSKINQTELEYSFSHGQAKVNLYTGRLLLEVPDISIGATYDKVGISHIYNSQLELPTYIKTHMGKGFKLQVQQYIYSDNYSRDIMYYIDGSGYTHIFNRFSNSQFYDTTGTGMILNIEPNNIFIIDPIGNKMIFENYRLVKVIFAQNSELSNHFTYDESGKLIGVYNSKNKSNYLSLTYDNKTNLLQNINCISRDKIIRSLQFFYDESNNLVKTIDNTKITLFKYYNDKLYYAVSLPDKSCLCFNYTDNKVTKVLNGFAYISNKHSNEDSKYVGENIFIGDELYSGDLEPEIDYSINGTQTYSSMNINSSNEISYEINKTFVTNKKNLRMVYYFNKEGYTSSIFEDYTSDEKNLRTLYKEPGEEILDNGDSQYSINKKTIHSIRMNLLSSSNIIMKKGFESFKSYRKYKCSNYKYYKLTFWLKLQEEVNNNSFLVKIKSKDNTKPIEFLQNYKFDSSAIGSWQLISVPVKIEYDLIESFSIEFAENDINKTCEIADMKICYCQNSNVKLINKTENDSIELDKIIFFKYVSALTNEEVIENIGKESYISDDDIITTYLDIFKKRNIDNKTDNFILSLCSGKRKILVKKVTLCSSNENIEIEFISNSYGIYGLKLFQQIISPDGKLVSNSFINFMKDELIKYKRYNCISQVLESKIDEENISSKSRVIADFLGNILKEEDEYGVKTIYEYDENRILSNKIIEHNNTSEKIVFESNTNNLIKNDFSLTNDTSTYYNEPYGYIEKVENNGFGEDTSNKLITNFGFNSTEKQLNFIENNIGGNNCFSYNVHGRLQGITPIGWEKPNMYGFTIDYNVYGDPYRFYRTYMEKDERILNLLVEKEVSNDYDKIKTKVHRSKGEVDESTILFDKYGQVTQILENNEIVTFEKKDIDESPGVALFETIIDSQMSKKICFSINNSNDTTGYSIKDYDDNIIFDATASGDKEVKYTFGDDDHSITTQINLFKNIIEKPRLNNTINTSKFRKVNGQNEFSKREQKTNYYYDDLGRLEIKKHTIDNDIVDILPTKIIETTKYKYGTLLKEDVIYTLDSETNWEPKFEMNYIYDNRGNIVKNTIISKLVTSSGTSDIDKETQVLTYNYDKANRLSKYCVNNENTELYTYNIDGTIDTITVGSKLDDIISTKTIKHIYDRGRLVSVSDSSNLFDNMYFLYDNYGNCVDYNGKLLEWQKGSLLKKVPTSESGDVTYYYDHTGTRSRKVFSNNKTVDLYNDGKKILMQKTSIENNGQKNYSELFFLYDIEGISGFLIGKNPSHYIYVKDATGNIISILDNFVEVARYEYDPWGKCTIVKDTIGLGKLNPFRWKGQYYDDETGLYYIDGRYYSPIIKQFINPDNPENITSKLDNIYGIYPYSITTSNTINIYNYGYTIETSVPLVYDPPKLNWWTYFWRVTWNEYWNSPLGKILAVKLFICALVLSCICPAFAPLFVTSLIMCGLSLTYSAVISGFKNKDQGNSFFKGFENYINKNWSQTLAISMALTMTTFYISNGCSFCFKKGTMVLTEDGYKKIEEIEVGDKVLSFNEDTGDSDYKEVVRLFRNTTEKWVHIDVNGETITCTPEHPFYILNAEDTPIVEFEGRESSNYKGQWVTARNLKSGIKVLLSNGKNGIINRVETEDLDESVATYNFEVQVSLLLLTPHRKDKITAKDENSYNVEGKGLVNAKDIQIDDKIILESGEIATVLSAETKTVGGPQDTYNFEVADFHTYYVGESGILVHNACGDDVFDVMQFDDAAVAEAKTPPVNGKGVSRDPSFSTFKRKLFAAQERLHPGTFAEGTTNIINGQKVILHHPLGRAGANLYNVVGVTQSQHLAIHAITGYRNAVWSAVNYSLGSGVF